MGPTAAFFLLVALFLAVFVFCMFYLLYRHLRL